MDNLILKKVMPIAEMLIIKRDVDLLLKMVKESSKPNPIFMMSIIPYAAMVCYEAIQYYECKGAVIEFDQKSRFSLRDIRNKAKFFDLKFNQIVQSTKNVDELQHRSFAQSMKFPDLAKWNIHDNLGIYFNSDKKILNIQKRGGGLYVSLQRL